MDGNEMRIWKPSVELNDIEVPYPSSSNNEKKLFTKTSLSKSQDNSMNLNRVIVETSQSYNNSPKPFKRQQSDFGLPDDSASISYQKRYSPPDGRIDKNNKIIEQKIVDDNLRTTEDMNSKLVHKQYNSPIDLYSMNNIRKTIEAHTELIAPGVKGINFMKDNNPINKQSEVYKLVREEEEQKTRPSEPSVSPISGQTVKLSTISNLEQVKSQEGSYAQKYSTPSRSQISCGSSPRCCECCQMIVGPFAKVQDRFIHPQCFNCTTCGTSLKNCGYFTIDGKLYCEIHAKQVAKIMRLQFNFTTSLGTSGSDQSTQSNVQPHEKVDLNSMRAAQEQISVTPMPGKFMPCRNPPATISTMFAERTNYQNDHDRYRPEYPGCQNQNQSPTSSKQVVYSNSGQSSNRVQSSFKELSMSSDNYDRRYIEEGSKPVSGRLPACVNCQVEIRGPYILAGKATWCKHCSESHFNCSSCNRSLLDNGFIEDDSHNYFCERCYEAFCAPACARCDVKIKGDCLNALEKKWHPSCFICGHCQRPFGSSSFYLEDNVPYCERDWKTLFTTKCYSCSYPIEAGDRWIKALSRNYHSDCFRCYSCRANLEGSTFYCKGGEPYCRQHSR